MPADLVPFNQTCPLVSGPLKIKEKSYLTDTPNANSHCEILSGKTDTLPIQHACLLVQCHSTAAATYMHACWSSVTATKTAAVQICLLVECCCKMDACLTIANQSACLLIFCDSCQLALCFSICHTCWYGICHACQCGASL